MAKQYNTKALLQDQIDEENKKLATLRIPVAISLGIGICSGIAFFLGESTGIISVISIIFLFIFVRISNSVCKTTGLEKVRINGHYKLVEKLKSFPDTYHIIYGLRLKTEEDCQSTLEAVVIGPSGIHVLGFSCKHGRMVGDKKDELWKQHNIGCGGTSYTNEFKNPTRFLGFQRIVLSRFLKNKGINAFIDGRYMFLNASELQTNCKDICFCDYKKLMDSIVNKKKVLSNVQIRHLIRLLGYEPQ